MCHNAVRDSSGDTLKTMHYLLVIPGMKVHEAAFIEALATIEAPALCRLLSRARREEGVWRGLAAWLLDQFGAHEANAEPAPTSAPTAAPSGPYACLGDGINPEEGAWAHAAPVSLKPDRDRLLLADPSRFPITADESAALIATLNRHFAGDPVFHAPAPDRWYARFTTPPSGDTIDLAEVAGRAIQPGRGGMAWHRLMNEIQMALHEHPVNDTREARGEPPINGVWLWGAGTLQPVTTPVSSVTGDVPLARGLARHAGLAVPATPADAKSWLELAPASGVHANIESAVARAELAGDVPAWRAAIQTLEQHWIAPLVDALSAGHIGMLTVYLAGGGEVLRAEATRQDLKRFWRQSKPLGHWCKLEETPPK